MKFITNIYRKDFELESFVQVNDNDVIPKSVQKPKKQTKELITVDNINYQEIADKYATLTGLPKIDCEICYEEVRSYIKCNICNITICYVCFLRNLYENPTEPKCINKGSCSYNFQDKTLLSIFKKSFFENNFRDILTLRYYEHELSNIPSVGTYISTFEDFNETFTGYITKVKNPKVNKKVKNPKVNTEVNTEVNTVVKISKNERINLIRFLCILNNVEYNLEYIPDLSIHKKFLRELYDNIPVIDSFKNLIIFGNEETNRKSIIYEYNLQISLSEKNPENIILNNLNFFGSTCSDLFKIQYYCMFIIMNLNVFTERVYNYLNIQYIAHGMKKLSVKSDTYSGGNFYVEHIYIVNDDKTKDITNFLSKFNLFRQEYHKTYNPINEDDIFSNRYVSKSKFNTKENVDPNEYKKCFSDGCNGILIRMKCTACTKVFCAKCHEERLEHHQCKEADILSVKEISKNTKPCPSCSSRIFRISGCDQMWCTNCSTAFNWKTMQIYKNLERFHNPEFTRFGGGHQVQNGCDNFADYVWNVNERSIKTNEIFNTIVQIYIDKSKFIKIKDFVINSKEKIEFIISFVLHSFRISTELNTNVKDVILINSSFNKYARKYRIDFIKNIIEREEFSRKIYLMRRRLKMKNDVNQVCQNYSNLISDICIQFSNTVKLFTIKSNNYDEHFTTIQNILDYLVSILDELKFIIKSFNQPNLIFACEIDKDGKLYMSFKDSLTNSFNI